MERLAQTNWHDDSPAARRRVRSEKLDLPPPPRLWLPPVDGANQRDSGDDNRLWLGAPLLGLLCTAATYLSLHGIGNLKDRAVALSLGGQRLSVGRLLPALGISDVVAGAIVLACLAAGLWLELRERLFSRWIDAASDRMFLAGFGILLAWLGHAYLFPGLLLAGDTGTHIARFHEIGSELAQHRPMPVWTNTQYLGSSLLGFTGPLTYVVGGALEAIVGDATTTAKLLLFALHMVAGWLAFALLRRLGCSRYAAALGALAYAGSFAHLHLFLYRGVFPQAFTICFLLAIFYAAEGMMRGRRMPWGDWALFALATGALVVNHQPHAPFVAIYLALFGAVRLATGHWRLAALPRLAVAGMLGALMATVAVLPLVAESGWVMIEPANSMFAFTRPTAHRLLDLVVWRNTRTTFGTDYWAYLGLVTVVLAAAGALLAARARFAGRHGALVLAVLPCLALSFVLSNPVVRDIMFLLLFVAMLAACGADGLRERWANVPRAGLVMLVLLLLDLSSTAIQPVARTDKQFQVEAGHYLAAHAPGARIVEVTLGDRGAITADMGPDASAVSYDAPVQRLAGYHNMAATRVHNYVATAIKLAEADLRRDGRLAPGHADLLALFNAARVFCTSPMANGCPASFAGVRAEGPLGLVVPIAGASPVLFSQHLIAMAPRADLDKPMLWEDSFSRHDPRAAAVADYLAAWLAAARPEWTSRQVQALPVLALPAGSVPPPTQGWAPRLEAYAVGVSTVRVTLSANAPGYVQLSHPLFAGNMVRVNGRSVTPIESSLHLVVVRIGAGTSRIEIAPYQTPVRRISMVVSLAALLATMAIAALGFVQQRRRSRREPERPAPA